MPSFYQVPEERVKPFGTVHALLCARECVSEPFVVINADDYYGVDAFRTIYAALSRLAETGEGTMVGYDLCNTVSEHGTVTRGVCHVNELGMLDRVVETFHLKPCADGKIRDIQENGDGPVYAPETPVSMNFCWPVKNGWQALQMSTRSSDLVERVVNVLPQVHLTVHST